MAPQPTRDDKFTFGLWTVGWQAPRPVRRRHPAGRSTRSRPCTASPSWAPTASPSTTTTSSPSASDAAERDRHDRPLPGGAGRDRPGRADGDHQPVHPPRLQGRRRSPATTATCAASRCARSLRNLDLAAELGARPTSFWGGREGAEFDAAKDVRAALDRYREGIDLLAGYVNEQGYDIRFAIEPKPNEPRGDILLPDRRPRAGVHRRAGAPRDGRPQPRGRPRADGRAELRRTASRRRCGRASSSTSTSTASAGSSTTRTSSSATATCSTRSRWSTCWRPAGRSTTGPRHFDYKPLRTEDIDGVWASAAANMRTYLLLKERAAAFRADPEVAEALAAAGVADLATPTLERRRDRRRPARRPQRVRGLRRRQDRRARLRLRPAGPARHRARAGRALRCPAGRAASTRRRSPARSSSATRRPARWSARAAPRTRTAPRSTRPRGEAALGEAIAAAGGLDDVAAIAVAGQQHGMVCLDEAGAVVRPALLWNDTRSAGRPPTWSAELGGTRSGPTPSAACPSPPSPSPSCAGSPTTSRTTPPRRPRSACRTTGSPGGCAAGSGTPATSPT